MDIPGANPHAAYVLEEKQRDWTLDPFLQIVISFLLPIVITDFYANAGSTSRVLHHWQPLWLGKAPTVKSDAEGWSEKPDLVSETESAFESDAAESNRV